MNRLRPAISLEDVVIGARFLWSAPAMFRHPITRDEARAALRRRFEHPPGPLPVLRARAHLRVSGQSLPPPPGLAGCEYGDVEKLVRQEGVESALAELYRRGVYLTLDELKERQPVVRGSATFMVDPSLVANPRAQVHLAAQTILLNASLGDQATLTRRACGCPVERLGWTTHAHTPRSHAKVTAGGMAFSDAEVIRVLEHDLPAPFGGSATDYQLASPSHETSVLDSASEHGRRTSERERA